MPITCEYQSGWHCDQRLVGENNPNGCGVLATFIHQSKFGGGVKIGEIGGAGPYWKENSWFKLCEHFNSEFELCPFSELAREEIEKITKKKKENGELY